MAWLLAAAATVGGTGPGGTKEKSLRAAVTIAVNASTSLESAQAQARAAVAAGETAVTILVGQGVTKALTKPIVLGAEDSGVAWRGAEGAVISGGASLPLSAFAPIPAADPMRERFQTSVAHQVLRADISAHRSALQYAHLSAASGEPLQLARWPDTNAADSDGVHDHWALTGKPPSENVSGFGFPAGAPIPANVSGTQAFGFWENDWTSSTLPVTSLRNGIATVPASKLPVYVKSHAGKFPSESRFFFLDQPEYLSAPGEYWLDKDRGHAYLLPPAEHASAFTLSLSQGLFEFRGAPTTGVSFRGLTLMASQTTAVRCGEHTGPGQMVACGARHIRVENCTLSALGSGIEVFGGRDWSISDTSIRHIRGAGVILYGGNLTTLESANLVVANCTVTDFNRAMGGFVTAVKISGVGIAVKNNVIGHAPAQGLLWSGNDHVIAGNVIHSVCREMFDCGAIYESQRDWAMRGTVISNNLIFEVGRAETACNVRTSCGRHAIYSDALTHGVTVRDNILVQPTALAVGDGNPHIIQGSSGIVNNGGRDNVKQ